MIHLSGSLAFDRIMTFPGRFEDHILPEKLHFLNVCFPIDHVEEKRGGTAGNIAYTLALLNEPSTIYTSVGKDFSAYGRELMALGISLDGVNTVESDFTACAYITSDQAGNQITGFSPAAMKVPAFPGKTPAVKEGDWALIGPGNVDDMMNLAAFYRENGVKYIFDPGQQITSMTGDQLVSGLTGATVLIGNDYEIELIGKMTGLDRDALLDRVEFLIVTYGSKGSTILHKGVNPYEVPAVKPEVVSDPTGAGDSYRSGLLKGLHSGMGIPFAARLGAVASSFCVEKYGTQLHSFNAETFRVRYETTFGPMPVLK
ncbi:MAG: carbohydrate kinase family protein [Mailhella sp.]|nr:carbohydrate kinase family protein [Mailhella sp.]